MDCGGRKTMAGHARGGIMKIGKDDEEMMIEKDRGGGWKRMIEEDDRDRWREAGG